MLRKYEILKHREQSIPYSVWLSILKNKFVHSFVRIVRKESNKATDPENRVVLFQVMETVNILLVADIILKLR